MTTQVQADITSVNQVKEDARIFKSRSAPTKDLNKAIVAFILLMMVMAKNMSDSLGSLGNDFQEYMLGQNMAGLTQADALFMTCLHEITNNSPEAQKLLKEMHFTLRAWGFSEGQNINTEKGQELYSHILAHNPAEFGVIKAYATLAYNALSKQLKSMFDDYESSGLNSSQRFAAGIVSEYWGVAVDQIMMGDAVDNKTVSAVVQLLNTEGQSIEADAKKDFQNAKSILEKLENIVKSAEQMANGILVTGQ